LADIKTAMTPWPIRFVSFPLQPQQGHVLLGATDAGGVATSNGEGENVASKGICKSAALKGAYAVAGESAAAVDVFVGGAAMVAVVAAAAAVDVTFGTANVRTSVSRAVSNKSLEDLRAWSAKDLACIITAARASSIRCR
jgi:hypothetical protein